MSVETPVVVSTTDGSGQSVVNRESGGAAADGADARWLNPDEQAVWRKLLAVKVRLSDRLDRELQAFHGITLADYEVLVHLSEAPGRSLRMAELAGLLSLSPSGLTRRVDGLVRRGLARRKACESDGRGSFAELTDRGFDLLAAAAPTHVAGVRRYLVDPLGGPGMASLADGLNRIDKILNEG